VNRVKKRKVRVSGIAVILIGLFYTALGVGLLIAVILLAPCLIALGLLVPGVWFPLVGVYKIAVGVHRLITG
jgi:hypothetical protein